MLTPIAMTISNADFELLSAYMDGQLDADQAAALEGRLDNQPELAEELEMLQLTRSLLAEMPERKVPKNFMLTPEMAGVTAKQDPWYSKLFQPWVPAVGAIAAIMLCVVLVGPRFLGGGFSASAPESVAMVEEAAEESADVVEEVAEAMEDAAEEEAAEEAEHSIQSSEAEAEKAFEEEVEEAMQEEAAEEEASEEFAADAMEDAAMEAEMAVEEVAEAEDAMTAADDAMAVEPASAVGADAADDDTADNSVAAIATQPASATLSAPDQEEMDAVSVPPAATVELRTENIIPTKIIRSTPIPQATPAPEPVPTSPVAPIVIWALLGVGVLVIFAALLFFLLRRNARS